MFGKGEDDVQHSRGSWRAANNSHHMNMMNDEGVRSFSPLFPWILWAANLFCQRLPGCQTYFFNMRLARSMESTNVHWEEEHFLENAAVYVARHIQDGPSSGHGTLVCWHKIKSSATCAEYKLPILNCNSYYNRYKRLSSTRWTTLYTRESGLPLYPEASGRSKRG